ncbi:hypothetical protein A3J56_02290 [Candidatus Giovannonibacteria bacterium RIFCSPHIGHO2_02_FULL_46_20]|uniref:Transcription regulator TrmB N-terminal domain-containing protein n=1 Tax=Candidatus Giovannonibacteria bacterium RIFCSPHIGHO2_02_FULL_46_20 TaxID=1798338 RepID=A0A1F5WEF5_9BACT|nr:MAG: hypothetical protein A3J56_02290 [Candidatus Giovannonibacteria bacterium RIFCSPHIGHO2_02_FULL_46_20]
MIELLIKIGFSENEARVYHALLELGNATAQQVAQRADVNRPTTYVQLDRLMKLGLASSFEKASERKNGKSKTYFRAEDPEHIKGVLEKEENQVKERGKSLEELLPRIEQLFVSSGDRPRVRFFEGIEGIHTMQEEFLKSGGLLVEGVTSWDDVLKINPAHQETYRPKRIQKGMRSRVIYTSSHGPVLQHEDPASLRESRYVSSDSFPIHADISVSGNRIAFVVLKEKPFGVIIENADIAKTVQTFFKLAWAGTNEKGAA